MALDDDRFVLLYDGICRLVKEYPFRPVYFKEDTETGLYKAYTTPQDWPDMGWAHRGYIPRLDWDAEWIDPDLREKWRRDSFFGIINVQEDLQPHDIYALIEAGLLEGIKVCETDDEVFMVKHEVFRLPLKADVRYIRCPCACGNYKDINLSLSSPQEGSSPFNMQNGGPIGYRKGDVRTHGETLSLGQTFHHEYLEIDPGGIHHKWHFWDYGTYGMVVFVSPQCTSYCPFRAPPVFTHPTCSIYPMGQLFTASWSGYYAKYETWVITQLPHTEWEHEGYSDPVLGGHIIDWCYNRFCNMVIGDNNSGINPNPEIPDMPQLTPDQIPELEEGMPFPDWDPWEVNFEGSLNNNGTSGTPCDTPCECPDTWPDDYDELTIC